MTTEKEQAKQAELAGLYEEYYNRIARYAYSRIGNKADAEDIAGEVFLKALQALKSYKEQGPPIQVWLFKIAHNLVVDYLRRNSKLKTVPLENINIAGKSDPESAAEISLEIERVKEALKRLSADQQEVIRLRFLAGLTSREVSYLMGRTDGAVREMQRAALERLRQILNEPFSGQKYG
ncbi:MAG: sigma-70 family RNA polymerase sigma factor [Dehalococcoidales bacterium]|nr:sigma-70 family RNA polymerase sigma factor [Dehalococcoidales bacterium]